MRLYNQKENYNYLKRMIIIMKKNKYKTFKKKKILDQILLKDQKDHNK